MLILLCVPINNSNKDISGAIILLIQGSLTYYSNTPLPGTVIILGFGYTMT